MMTQQSQTTHTKTTLTAIAAAGLLAAAGNAQASFMISMDQQDGKNGFSGPAFDAETNFLDRLDQSKTENFEGIAEGTTAPQDTAVGDFQATADAEAGSGTACLEPCEEPAVFDEDVTDVTDSGRYDVTGADSSKYLDSNDVTEVAWDVDATLDGTDDANALGLFVMDPADEGALFEITTDGGDTELFSIDSGQDDGELFYLSAISTDGPITDARVMFENTDDNTADGFGIDDATVGVPTPGMLAMLGSGLLAMGLFGRSRGKSAAA